MSKRKWEPDHRRMEIDFGNGVILHGDADWQPSDTDQDYVRFRVTDARLQLGRIEIERRLGAFAFLKGMFPDAKIVSTV